MSLSKCKSCGASIRWAKTPTGKSMPLDFEPAADGNIVLIDGLATAASPMELLSGKPVFRSHFATCPNAQAHRKGRS